MSTGAWILVVAVVAALAFGSYRALTDGRFGTRGRTTPRAEPVAEAAEVSGQEQPEVRPAAEVVHAVGAELGERATLLQFSSAFCAPCRVTRLTLAEVVGLVDGVAHVEVDAEEHLDATRALGILRTPTTIVLDAAGREVTRASGAPKRDQVLAALAQVPSAG
ncbi:MAG: TlpA family protein disulfide reductase [Nocardioides sp.]|uniref:TlpA family protein disulfide reductase n=1 Tax=Nocardioides sp. TaxID=35761 RepID=UPI003F0513F7